MKDYSSPCVGICDMNDDFLCEGCGRNAAEIENWYTYEPTQRKEILKRIIADNHPIVVDLADYEEGED